MEISVESFVKRQVELLILEREAESQQLNEQIHQMTAKEAQDKGVSILDVMIESTKSALMGRCCHVITRTDSNLLLPSHSFKVGDEVVLYMRDKKTKAKGQEDEPAELLGIVSRISPKEIDIVCDMSEDAVDLLPPLRLDLHASEQTHLKMVKALQNLTTASHPLANILFNGMVVPLSDAVEITPFNSNLNTSQIEAVQHALGSPYCALIHGPPGTGKTSTVVELIFQYIKKGYRILVTCPSNTAIDTIIQRLSTSALDMKNKALRMVRLGHPARINKSILSYSLDALIVEDDGTDIVRDVRRDLDRVLHSMSTTRERSQKKELRSELKELRKEARQREAKVVANILHSRNVVLCTNVGASSRLLRDEEFDVVVIDEAAQALEASCWIPILLGRRCVMFGDHKQLPPTIKSVEAAANGLSTTLFQRIMSIERLQHTSRLLNIQYRMNRMIAEWASSSSYEGKLISDVSIADHTLMDLPHVNADKLDALGVSPMILIDTAGAICVYPH
jgi:ATP-dependent RNA/DNA helicase IGHMBP2